MPKYHENSKTFKHWLEAFYYYFDIIYRVVKSLFLILLFLIITGGVFFSGVSLGYFASLVDPDIPSVEDMEKDISHYASTSSIYYDDGTLISDVRSDLSRTPITFEDMSENVIKAIIAIEDEYFYAHNGVVPKAIFRALFQDIVGSDSSSGGSTLTQQVIKQQLLTNEVTHERKVNEILLALRLEKIMSKKQIIESYLNVSPFGRNNKGENIAGLYEAAHGIFGVSPKELTLPQAAFIAGLPQSPILYSPFTQTGELKEDLSDGLNRKDNVLFNMYREGIISKQDYTSATTYDLSPDFLSREELEKTEERRSYVYDIAEQSARDIIIEQLIEQSGHNAEEITNDETLYQEFYDRADDLLRSDGLKITTTIDKTLHDRLRQVTTDYIDSVGFDRELSWTDENGVYQSKMLPIQVGSTLIENKTGKVLAFVGGRDYEYSNFNIPFQSRRSSGSTIKPLVAYGPALAEHIITPETIIPDTPYSVPSYSNGVATQHNITNYGATTNDWLPARTWLARSQNIPTAKVYMELFNKGLSPEQYMRRMGIGSEAIPSEDFDNPATSLGGLRNGMTITELTAAYASIANNGYFNTPHVIEKIEQKNGDVIYEYQIENEQVWDEATNYLLVQMLKEVINSTYGTSNNLTHKLAFGTQNILSKSGISNNYTDIWFIGATPKIAFGNWMGYENQQLKVGFDYGQHPSDRSTSIWARYMNAIYEVRPDLMAQGEDFYFPSGQLSQASILSETGMKPGSVRLPNGSTAQARGSLVTKYFSNQNIPALTAYDFALGASSQELAAYWNSQLNTTRPSSSNTTQEESPSSHQEDATTTFDEGEHTDDNSIRDFLDNLFGRNE